MTADGSVTDFVCSASQSEVFNKMTEIHQLIAIRLFRPLMPLITMLIGVALLFSVVLNTASARTVRKPNAAVPQAPVADRFLAASYYRLSGGFTTYLTLNNKGNDPIDVTPSLFSLSGVRQDLPPQTIPAHSFRVIDLSTFGLATPMLDGSIQVAYFGEPLLVGAQVRIVHPTGSLIFDEQLRDIVKDYKSSKLEGLWWTPDTAASMKVAVSNTTGNAVSTTISATRLGTTPLTTNYSLSSHETKWLDLKQNLLSGQVPETSGGISITHTGDPGAVVARTIITVPASGYSSSMEYTDPSTYESSSLHGTGVRIRSFEGQELRTSVVLRNVGTTSATITVNLPLTKTDGQAGVLTMMPATLSPGEVYEMVPSDQYTPAQKDQVASAGIEIEHTGGAGTVVAAVQTRSVNLTHVFRVPLVNPESQPSSAGTFPWSLKAGSATVIYIKNATETTQYFTMSFAIDEPDASPYTMDITEIAAGQTKMIDLLALQTGQVPDKDGTLMPAPHPGKEWKGQVHWSQYFSDQQSLIGRSEQIEASAGTSSTYACINCCDDSFFDGRIKGPEEVTSGIHEFKAQEKSKNCENVPLSFNFLPAWRATGPGAVHWAVDADDADVASIVEEGATVRILVQNVTVPRPVTIYAQWRVEEYLASSSEVCTHGPGPGLIPGEACCEEFTYDTVEEKTFLVVPVSVDRLEATVPSTPDAVTQNAPPRDIFASQLSSLNFTFVSGTYLSVPYGIEPITISAVSTQQQPGVPNHLLKWKVDRNPDDYLTGEIPIYQLGERLALLDPIFPGSFRVVYYLDADDDGEVDEGEQLKVLLLAVVRFSAVSGDLQTNQEDPDGDGDSFDLITQLAFLRLAPDIPAQTVLIEVSLEGGGPQGKIGTEQIRLGSLGNLVFNDFQVDYGPGEFAREAYFGAQNFCDCPGENQQPASGGSTAFRLSSTDTNRAPLTPAPGIGVTIEANDTPAVIWPIHHQYTNSHYARTLGGLGFVEYLAAYSEQFPNNYVVLQEQTWNVQFLTNYINNDHDYSQSVLAHGSVVNRVSVIGSAKPASQTSIQVRGVCARNVAGLETWVPGP